MSAGLGGSAISPSADREIAGSTHSGSLTFFPGD